MLSGTKPASSSLGVWGGAIAALAGLGGLVGYAVTPEDAAQLGQHADQVAAGVGQVLQAITSLIAMVGGAAAVVGRITATMRIGRADTPVSTGG